MNTGIFSIDAMDRPVIRVVMRLPGHGTRYKYFSSWSSAARYAAWQQVYAKHRVFDPNYTVNGLACECVDPYRSERDDSECPLHNHDDGYYVREMRRIKQEILREVGE